MHKEHEKLTELTKRTNDRLKNEAYILPSKYYEAFIHEAKMLDMNPINNNKDLVETGKILEKLECEIFGQEDPVHHAVETLKAELSLLRKQYFADHITSAYNRSWLYQYKLHEGNTFRDSGYIVSIIMEGYDDIEKEYGRNSVEIMTGLLSEFIIKKLNHDHLEYDIVRFRKDRFLVFVYSMKEEELMESMVNLSHDIKHHPFKFRHKLLSLSIDHTILQYIRNESFPAVLDQIEEKEFKKRLLQS